MATTTAHAIAAGIRHHLRDRITYLPDRKLHALLYLAQGLWLLTEEKPLFNEPLIATEQGVRVDADLTATDPGPLGDSEFAVTALVASRYGGLSAMDLEALLRGQSPWQATPVGAAVDVDLIRDTFRAQAEIPEGTVTGYPQSMRAQLRRPADDTPPASSSPDSPSEIQAFLDEVRARM